MIPAGAGGPGGEEDDFVEEVFGGLGGQPPEAPAGLKAEFQPWHHPVKQIVRDEQWAKLVARLFDEEGVPPDGVLRYLTLPGNDLLDVRVVAEACVGRATVRYLGFNNWDGANDVAPWTESQATLQQESLADPQSLIVPDRIEDIAAMGSNAATHLAQHLPFDVINLDACSHLAFVRPGRTTSLFDALGRIVEHQLRAQRTWLLFVSTRASTANVGDGPKAQFDAALAENLAAADEFGQVLRSTVELGDGDIAARLHAAWGVDGPPFLRLFAICLGKHILRFIHAQPSFQAKVELASIYCYRVKQGLPDMLAMAFRIRPGPLRIAVPGVQLAPVPAEPRFAIGIARRAARMYDLDDELVKDAALLQQAVQGTERLLQACNYDLDAYRQWLENHPERPIKIAAQ